MSEMSTETTIEAPGDELAVASAIADRAAETPDEATLPSWRADAEEPAGAEPWRDSPEFRDAVREAAQAALHEHVASYAQQAEQQQALEEFANTLDPWAPDFLDRLSLIADARVQAAVAPLLEQQQAQQDAYAVHEALDRLDVSRDVDRGAVFARAEEIFQQWGGLEGYEQHQWREVGEAALQAAVEELAPQPARRRSRSSPAEEFHKDRLEDELDVAAWHAAGKPKLRSKS